MRWFKNWGRKQPETWQSVVSKGIERVNFSSEDFERRKLGRYTDYEQELFDYYGWSSSSETIQEYGKNGWMFTNNFLLWVTTENDYYRNRAKDNNPEIEEILCTTEVEFPDLWMTTVRAIETHWVLTDPYTGVEGIGFVASSEHEAVMKDSKHNKETHISRLFDVIAPKVAQLDIDFNALHA